MQLHAEHKGEVPVEHSITEDPTSLKHWKVYDPSLMLIVYLFMHVHDI